MTEQFTLDQVRELRKFTLLYGLEFLASALIVVGGLIYMSMTDVRPENIRRFSHICYTLPFIIMTIASRDYKRMAAGVAAIPESKKVPVMSVPLTSAHKWLLLVLPAVILPIIIFSFVKNNIPAPQSTPVEIDRSHLEVPDTTTSLVDDLKEKDWSNE